MCKRLLKFFGLGSSAKQAEVTSKSILDKELEKRMEEFNNRTIHKKLTIELIDQTSDENLIQLIFDNLSANIPEDYTKEYETVLTFTKAQQAIYMIWWLEGEVNNGGFNQYYFNSSGQFAELTPDALRLIGAYKYAELTTRANEIFGKEKELITKHYDGTLEGFSKSYKDNPLNGLSDEFYDLYKVEDLQKLQIEFIRKNKTEFI